MRIQLGSYFIDLMQVGLMQHITRQDEKGVDNSYLALYFNSGHKMELSFGEEEAAKDKVNEVIAMWFMCTMRPKEESKLVKL